jgi:hypothetical protein
MVKSFLFPCVDQRFFVSAFRAGSMLCNFDQLVHFNRQLAHCPDSIALAAYQFEAVSHLFSPMPHRTLGIP